MDEPMGYYVLRTTTDKLASMLNGFSEDTHITQITHVGGRDWVVIAECSLEGYESRLEWAEAEGMA